MKVSYNWLSQLVDHKLNVQSLGHALTMAGLEVEETTPVAAMFDRIVVGEIKTTVQHPNADKLRVCEVDVGTGSLLQIVCGAPNAAPNMKVPCALVGAKLPGLEIKQAKLRGVESNGMLCSARELGISEENAGLLQLADDAKLGQDIRDYLDLNDVYYTLKLTPNRGDCLSMFGIARDAAAITGATLRLPKTATVSATIDDSRSIKLTAAKACSRDCGRVIRGINPSAKSPDWMVRQLERAGFRSISPLVDITNYLTLERGRPMHAFDLDKLKGGIDVRFAKAGETLTLLNEQEVQLKPHHLLICDDSGPVAMGGVMGGLSTMVGDSTINVFFEAAYFDPDVIQGRTRELGINSDAAHRFERGVDPQSARDGIEEATRLTLEICGGQAGPVNETTGELPVRKPVTISFEKINALIGKTIAREEVLAIFDRLQFAVDSTPSVVTVTAPSYRFDINIPEDLVEEVARIHGFDNVPATITRASTVMLSLPDGSRSRAQMRRSLAGMGYQEVINYAFVDSQWEKDFCANSTPVTLANPIASHMSVMRTSLIGGIVSTLQGNLNRGEERLFLFEIGRCFLSDATEYSAQPERVAGLAYGRRVPEQWGSNKDAIDFFAMKGDVEALIGSSALSLRFEPTSHPALHPGRGAKIFLDNKIIGMVGELHPKWQQKYDLPQAPIVFELEFDALTQRLAPKHNDISRTPVVRRDLAVVMNDSVPIATVLGALRKGLPPVVKSVELFDIFKGEKLDQQYGVGKKSLAFLILMQDNQKTMTDSEVIEVFDKAKQILSSEFQATVRD